MRRRWDGAANPCVSLRWAAGPARIGSLASPEGMLVTPIRQFVRAPPRAPSARGLDGSGRLDGPIIRTNTEDLARMDDGELSLLLGELAFAAADYEATAIRHVVLERLSQRRGAAGNPDVGAALAGHGLAWVDCKGTLAEGIVEGARMLRGKGHGGQGLVVYEPLAHESPADYSQRQGMRCAGISVGYRVAPGGPPLEQAGWNVGIMRVGSWALDEPPAAGGLSIEQNASIMFDPHTAFSLRDAPRLWLEVWREWDGRNLAVKPTHMLRIDMNEDAVCLLLHTSA